MSLPGTERACSFEQTLAAVTPYLAEAGVTRVADVTGLDVLGIPVTMVVRPEGRALSVAQGKGATLLAAKVSGIMEALEQAHGERCDLTLRHGSELELRRVLRLVATERLPRRSSAPLDQTPMLWASGKLLSDGAEVWVPFELVHLDYRMPLVTGTSRFTASSNGLAAGNCWTEAVCHGLLEAVERHQTQLFYALDADTQAARRVKLDSVNDPLCRTWLDRIADTGLACTLWDLSDGLGVPCFLCDLFSARPDPLRSIPRARGVGCHTVKSIAMARAIGEAAQTRLTTITGARDDISPQVHAALQHADAQQHSAGERGRAGADRCYADLCTWSFDTFESELAWLQGRLADRGFGDVVVVDLSPADRPYRVVRCVVPGLSAPHPELK